MQVGASHRAAKVPNARWRRRQWRSDRTKERQLQARPLHPGGRRHPPVATRGYSYAPRPEEALRITVLAAAGLRSVTHPEGANAARSAEHTHELQSRHDLAC